MMQLGIFDLNDRLDQLSKIGDPLEVLNDKEAVCPNHRHSPDPGQDTNCIYNL